MAISNSYDYSLDRDTLIRTAFERIRVAVEGESLDSEDITVAARVLNLMIKAWVVYGLHVWKRDTHTIDPLVADQQYYVLGAPTPKQCSVSGSGTTATVTMLQHGFSTGDSVTISGATVDTDFNGTFTITVTDQNTFTYTAGGTVTGTESVVCQDNEHYTAIRPERILSVDRKDSNGVEIDLTQLTRQEFDDLPNKTTSGTPVNYHYERRTGGGRVYIWPVADSNAVTDYTLEITYQLPIQDVDSSTDNFDFPQEWLEALSYGLAYRLSSIYGLPIEDRVLLKRDSDMALQLVLGYDVEDGSIYFQPDV